jgi:hypothetical protein
MVDTATVQPIRTIEESVALATRRWNTIDTTIEAAQTKVASLRIETGKILNELRSRIDAGEAGELATWWEWYGDNFTRSRSDAEKLMALARADDPVAAHEAEKARNAEQHRFAYQHKKEAAIPAPAEAPREKTEAPSRPSLKLVEPEPAPKRKIDKASVEAVIAAFLALLWPERREFVKRLRQVYRDKAPSEPAGRD